MSKISVIMPLYNGKEYLRESIESIQRQTYTNWEFIIVNEFGSDDRNIAIIEEYSQADKRIKLLQNNQNLGLAASLNEGIKIATGDLIARVDVDDPSYPTRFEKQVKFLEENPDIILCGSLQRSVTTTNSYIQYVPCEAEELKVGLLFGCEISHCSVMFRKDIFVKNNWWYNPSFLGEDYELWTRVLMNHNVKMANIPEVLVDHRWGFENISIEKGESLDQEVRELSARFLSRLNIEVSEDEMKLLSGWRNKPTHYAEANIGGFLQKGHALLETIKMQNDIFELFCKEALEKVLDQRWDWICESCGLNFMKDREKFTENIKEPVVTVLLPVSDEILDLRICIDSVLNQTIKSIELYIIYDSNVEQGIIEIINVYKNQDTRVKTIKSEEIINRASALNLGMHAANGKYITSITANDILASTKLMKQVELLIKNKKIKTCCTGSRNLRNGKIHTPAKNSKHLKAALLFGNAFHTSTLMVQLEELIKYNIYYNEDLENPDYDFISRLSRVSDMAGLEEILCDNTNTVRFGAEKYNKCLSEVWMVFLSNLKENLNLNLEEVDVMLLVRYGFLDIVYKNQKTQEYKDCVKKILSKIYDINNSCQYYNSRYLLRTLDSQWRKDEGKCDWNLARNIYCLEQIFNNECIISKWKKTAYILTDSRPLKGKINYILKGGVKKAISPIFDIYRKNVMDVLCKHVEDMTWNRYQLVAKKVDNIQENISALKRYTDEANYVLKKRNLSINAKIRIVFLFQIPSFWPSWESFYYACVNDIRFDVKLVFLDETNVEKTQMKGAEFFLQREKIDYVSFENFNLEEYAPHIMVYQTPYDQWHRKYHIWSETIKRMGIRIVYIPYGIEIADTEDARYNHFEEDVVSNSWRLYTFSSRMKQDYNLYCENKRAVRALGHPKFDAYFTGTLSPNENVLELSGGRKVVLWKVHFPKFILKDGIATEVTPKISEYEKFIEYIKYNQEIFFVFMPHPKFLDGYGGVAHAMAAQKLVSELSKIENVYIDRSDDYRNSLVSADYIIVDRSAVMVEVGALGVPILAMTNMEFQEPMTDAIKPLIKSYYQGETCQDMIRFVEMCISGKDPKHELREQAFKICIPYYDGNCGLRIKEDILQSLQMESYLEEGNERKYFEEISNQLQIINERLTLLE